MPSCHVDNRLGYLGAVPIAEYLTRLILTNDGICHVSFSTIAARVGVNPKRIQKWLPLLCGEPWLVSLREWDFWNMDQEYGGRMFVKVAEADHPRRLAQSYRLSKDFACTLQGDQSAPSSSKYEYTIGYRLSE